MVRVDPTGVGHVAKGKASGQLLTISGMHIDFYAFINMLLTPFFPM